MKTFLKFFQTFLLMCGVFAAETDERKTVMEGDSVTLKPDITQIQGITLMLWRFGGPFIAQIEGSDITYSKDKMFIDRLQLNQTGSLTIKNMRTNHSGLYELDIERKGAETINKKFSVTVHDSPSVFDTTEAEMKIVSVTEGDPVTLPVPQLYGDELIVWRSGYEGKRIAKYDIEAKSSPLYNTDERFKDRLKLDHQTGSLIITNTRTTDSGLYTVKISSNKQTLYKRFTVIVSAAPEPPMSAGAKAGIVVGVVVLLVFAAAAGGVYYYRREIKTELPSETLSKTPGDKITLKPDTEIQTSDEIQWLFGVEDTLIAEIKKETGEMTYDGPDMIFKGKLTLDKKTGSLTIECINTDHSGLYTLKIKRGRETLYKKIQLSMDVKCEAVIVGDSVCLLTGLTEIQTDDEIQWIFREKNQLTLIAKIPNLKWIPNTYDGPDGIFKDCLELDKQTGNLTIKNSKFKHAGCYEVMIRSSKGDTNKTYFVIIRGGSDVHNEMYMMKEQEEIVEYDEGIEGDSVHLITGLTEIPKDDEMQWLFRDENQQTSTIATIKGEINKTYDGPDGIFKDSLELDTQTGNLKIKDSKFKHAGCYKVKIRSSKGDTNKIKTYFVIIRDGEDPYVNVNEEETDGDSHYVDVNELRKDTGKRVNESKELKPLLNGEDVDVVNEQEGTSSL